MCTITATEFKRNFGKYVIKGQVEKIQVTHRGKLIFTIVPEKERLLDEVTLDTVKNLKLDNAFEGTGMLPKIKAAITFLENNNEGRVIITDMEHVSAALKGRTGTIITA